MNPAPDFFESYKLAAIGLVWDEGTRKLVDPETGEIYPLEEITDEATAKAASYRIFCNASAIKHLDAEKKAITHQIDQRKKRAEVLREMYLEGLKAFARPLIAAAKRGQSVTVGYCKVGFAASRRSVKAIDEAKALRWALTHAPEAARVTVDLSAIPAEARREVAITLAKLAFICDDDDNGGAVTGDVRTTLIPEDVPLPSAIWTVKPAGEEDWYAR